MLTNVQEDKEVTAATEDKEDAVMDVRRSNAVFAKRWDISRRIVSNASIRKLHVLMNTGNHTVPMEVLIKYRKKKKEMNVSEEWLT